MLSQLNLTSELDLMNKHPKIEYLFLPYNTNKHNPNYSLNKPLKICHSPTNRYYKIKNFVLSINNQLEIIKTYLKSNYKKLSISYIFENKPLGTIGSLFQILFQ